MQPRYSTYRHLLFAVGGLWVLAQACRPAHTHLAYRDHDPTIVYAMICHGGKRTIRVPADEWPAHRAHGDYRGPCRARGVAGAAVHERKPPENTLVSHRGNPQRLKRSREAWEAHEAAAAHLIDSMRAAEPRR